MPSAADAAPDLDAILFDVDETLFDRVRAQSLVLDRMRDHLHDLLADTTIDEIRRAWDASDRATNDLVYVVDQRIARDERSRIFLQELGLDPSHTSRLTDAYLDLYGQIDAPIEGAVDVVTRCARRYRVGVVSNAFPDVQYRKLATLGLGDVFACVVLSEEFGVRKPDPAIFHEGCRRLDVEPSRCLYVGDSWRNDVEGATAAGLPVCWLNAADRAPGGPQTPTLTIRRLPALLDWLRL